MVTVLIVLRVGKIALVCGVLKGKYIYSKYRVRSVLASSERS